MNFLLINVCADVTYKLIAAGDGGVGKTTLLKRYVEGTFDLNTHMTIGVEIHKKTIEFSIVGLRGARTLQIFLG
ncbi:MAG: hypothetical protein EU544_03070 [Promethearchaeota archaeon]|nr:MAG: hypothetical protein EU544_03070 [Candidatus Lokiarchaeota archaeon]